MKCPDCSNKLTEMTSESGIVFRCFKCGGFWLDSYTANKLTANELSRWRRISISSGWFSAGKGVCPADGLMLTRYTSENIPPKVMVSRCQRCGKWWFPKDELFSYKPAIESKINYMRQWGILSSIQSVLLPVMSVIVLVIGTAVGVEMIKRQQQVGVAANSAVSDLAVTYLGSGKAMVVFKAETKIHSIEYGVLNIFMRSVKVDQKGDLYVAEILNLSEGKLYYLRVGGKEFKFRAQ